LLNQRFFVLWPELPLPLLLLHLLPLQLPSLLPQRWDLSLPSLLTLLLLLPLRLLVLLLLPKLLPSLRLLPFLLLWMGRQQPVLTLLLLLLLHCGLCQVESCRGLFCWALWHNGGQC
jgi:hypothetical protein